VFAFTRRRASREEDKGTFDSPMRWQIKTNNTTKWGKKMKVNLFFSYLQPRELRVLLHAPDGGALAVVHHRAFTRVSVCLCVRRVCSQPRGCETVERKRAAVQPKKRPSRQNPKIKRLKTQRLFFSLSAARCVCVRCACGASVGARGSLATCKPSECGEKRDRGLRRALEGSGSFEWWFFVVDSKPQPPFQTARRFQPPKAKFGEICVVSKS
jgi:hypothetical protein